jgi:hypothetical protein
MNKGLKVLLLIVLIFAPILFYKILNQGEGRHTSVLSFRDKEDFDDKPDIALIFDDFGESLSDLKEVYSLGIPLTISVIPNLKFSKNIAHIASRCNFSVLIHLPLEPKDKNYEKRMRFIGAKLGKHEIKSLLRDYLNSIRIAIGVNNHMGSEATENLELMRIILEEVKKRNLIFIDSRTSVDSVAYEEASRQGLICGYNEGFLDYSDDIIKIEERMEELIKTAQELGKIIVIAHPKKTTIDFLKNKLPIIREKVDFITIKEYFGL